MNIEGAANFLVGSLLMGLGVIIIALVAILLNNLFSKYWKPFTWGIFPQYHNHTIYHEDQGPKLEPSMTENKEKKSN